MSKAGQTFSSYPRSAKSMAPTFCVSLHMRTQSPHWMHLLGFLVMDGLESSILYSFFQAFSDLSNLIASFPYRPASSCSLQRVFFGQVVHSLQWDARYNLRIVFLYCFSLGVLVRISMPFFGGVEQEVMMFPFWSSTMHILQEP